MTQKTPAVGQPLPDFSMPAAVPREDGTIADTTITNQDFKGQPSVLFIYPRDNTPGCTIEVCSFRELYPEFLKRNIKVVGMSRDTIRAHHKFIEGQKLPYPLAADLGTEILKSWGLLVNKTMYGKPVTGVARTTYLMDGKGIVRHIFEKVTPLGHAQAVLDIVAEMK